MRREFGEYRIDSGARVVCRLSDTRMVLLGGREFDVLWSLVRNSGRPVTVDELLQEVWKDAAVEKNSVAKAVAGIRKKLGAQYVLTAPGAYQLGVEGRDPESQSQPVAPAGQAGPTPDPLPVINKFLRPRAPRVPAWVALLGLLTFVVLVGAVLLLTRTRAAGPPQPVGRLLVHSTSENSRRTRIPLARFPKFLAVSSDARKLFVTNDVDQVLTVIDLPSRRITEFTLPTKVGSMALVSDRLYITSRTEGVIVWNIDAATVERVIQTHGATYDIAATPDGRKLFVAMEMRGLKRISIGNSEVAQITDRVCPMHLRLDPPGRRLYVSYQCTGPSGTRGRDEVEVFDADTEARIGAFSGVPMVGGSVAVSPDAALVAVSGSDACAMPVYADDACPFFPSWIVHVFRASDGHFLRTLAYPTITMGMTFLDQTRLLLAGEHLVVVDDRKYTTLEELVIGPDVAVRPIWDTGRRRIYTALVNDRSILTLEPEDASCIAPDAVAMMHTGDGTFEDSIGLARLVPHGEVSFQPGKVGQAFVLNGEGSFLLAKSTGYYEFGQDSAIAFYVKFADLRGQRTLLYRMTDDRRRGMLVQKDVNDHIGWDLALSNGGVLTLRSAATVTAGSWIHVVISRIDRRFALYLNGALAASNTLEGEQSSQPALNTPLTPLYLGAGPSGRNSVSGKLDEIAYYNRGLTGADVKRLYEMREAGPCKP
jgi:hypothetical protein